LVAGIRLTTGEEQGRLLSLPYDEGVEQEAGEGGLAAFTRAAHRDDGRRPGAGIVRHRLRGLLPFPLPLRRFLFQSGSGAAAAAAAASRIHRSRPLASSPGTLEE